MTGGAVCRGVGGVPVYNGAVTFEKIKDCERLQRVISNLTPISQRLLHVDGGESSLPYVGPLGLLTLEVNDLSLIPISAPTRPY